MAVIMGLRQAVHEYSAVAQGAIPVAICFLYGLSDEIHQLFVENRMFDPADLAADVMGAAVATGLLSLVFRIKDSRG